MPITAERFELTLRTLDASQWRLFERLAGVFLAAEFPNLRPVGAMSGDGGADGLLFQVEDDPSVLAQYSVRKDFASKIDQTCKRIKETFPDAKVLVYVTNQELGPKTVELRRTAREKYKIHLDPRGLEWLSSVRNSSSATMAEAEELAQKIVDPLVAPSGEVIARQAQALEDLEAKAAFVYLGLQWEDDTREKGLTKLCFEAIVRSVLRDTTSEEGHRRSRQDIYDLVAKLLPGHHRITLQTQVDGALSRLNKKYIRHWRKVDEFCLTWDERVRLSQRLAELSALDSILRSHLHQAIETSLREVDNEIEPTEIDGLVEISRKVIERVLLDRGEAFASAVTKESSGDVRPSDIEAVVEAVVGTDRGELGIPTHVLAGVLQALLVTPPTDIRRYLRGLADTYTLFAFMRETPDVQAAVVKMFSEGDIWLDTTVALPLLAEELLEPADRSHTELLASARECGLGLYVTRGVLEELATHISRCESYLRALSGEGAVGWPPFLLNSHRLAGLDDKDFTKWLDNFRGGDPEYDILEYLEDVHGIALSDLNDFAEQAPLELRAAVAEVFHENRDYHEKRRALLGIPPMDTITRDKLVGHDVENYVGVIARREQRNERRSAFGYKSWWLTLDRTAFRVHDKLTHSYNRRPPASPAISPDFMLNYLAVGPIRARLSRRSEGALPLMLNMSVLDAVPAELLQLAERLREELSDLQPRIVRRKIRETLEDARRLMGPMARGGQVGLTEEITKRLITVARKR
jgi:hypothetical protein